MNPPSNYDQVYIDISRRGARVLALGRKSLGTLSHQQVIITSFSSYYYSLILENDQVRDMSRDDIEKNLEFVGFVVISCPLKVDSKSVIKEILNSSHHVRNLQRNEYSSHTI